MRNLILGTDWWTDCDDAVALRLMARSALKGEIRLMGVVINGCMADSVASVDGFLQCEGLDGIPLGIDRQGTDFGGHPPYQKRLAKYARTYLANEDAEDGVRLYRRLLMEANGPVEMVEIGYMQAVAALLESPGDDISPLNGWELVKSKVSRVWAMAGKWDENPGRENNFARNARSRAAGQIFCEKMPVPVTFLGFEVGVDVISGSRLSPEDPLHMALKDHGSENGRSSWDPMLVLLAMTGDEERAGYDTVTGHARVDGESGENFFRKDEHGPHRYVIRRMEREWYRDQIDERIG